MDAKIHNRSHFEALPHCTKDLKVHNSFVSIGSFAKSKAVFPGNFNSLDSAWRKLVKGHWVDHDVLRDMDLSKNRGNTPKMDGL